jgi:hypothetical protein
MSWMSQVGNLLQQYAGGGSATPSADVHDHFDQVAKAAPQSTIASGLAAAFQSGQTAGFGPMLGTLFSNSSGEQKAGLLNQLLGSVNPAMLTTVLSGAGLSGVLGSLGSGSGAPQITPEQAQKISPEVVQQLATHAQSTNPSIVDSVSGFYAQHSGLIKTLGGAALTVALAKVAQHQQSASA